MWRREKRGGKENERKMRAQQKNKRQKDDMTREGSWSNQHGVFKGTRNALTSVRTLSNHGLSVLTCTSSSGNDPCRSRYIYVYNRLKFEID